MLLNTEELLALANGDVGPDRLADLLDRLEHCNESADALQVLVSLRVNREEALQALRAAEKESRTPIPHPSARIAAPTTDWARQGLRLAATVALVAIVSVWAAGGFFGTWQIDTTLLATEDYESIAPPPGPQAVDLTSDSQVAPPLAAAYAAMDQGDFEAAKRLLQGLPAHSSGHVQLYLGTSHYFLKEYEQALEHLSAVREMGTVTETAVLHQASWYEANTLLAMGQPINALGVLETTKSASFAFQEPAADLYTEICDALGITPFEAGSRQ